MPKFTDIPQLTRDGKYQVNIPWAILESTLVKYAEVGIDFDPDFQRGHVWNETQQIRYVEFILRGGKSSRTIYFNHDNWSIGGSSGNATYLIDGKQRLWAVKRFLNNEIEAFGYFYSEYDGELRLTGPDFVFNVNDLKTRAEVLQWYLDLNAGGVAHTDEEIDKVKKLLEEEGSQKCTLQ